MSNPILSSIDFLASSKDFVELNHPGYQIDLRYGTTNNFVGVDMYGPFKQAYLHKIAAAKLSAAFQNLQSKHPDYRFIIFDALRPRSIQRVLWNAVEGTPGEKYIARPEPGSLHNFGFAVDLSILDAEGRELDMGAGFDDFRDIAQPQLEQKFLSEGLLTRQHLANRHLLRDAMETAGFKQLQHEWWHFDAMPKSEVKERFTVVE